MKNHLSNQSSPYLLQHADNPVNWYPWCEEAFTKAKQDNKPIFLSIGYSTCHWCHVMAHESFEDKEVAKLLNQNFISIKVDKEERPDIDSIYMAVCTAYTGRGGWPMSIFMTPDKKPFFAGTYFPKQPKFGTIGLIQLLNTIQYKWQNEQETLVNSAETITNILQTEQSSRGNAEESLILTAVSEYKQSFDREFGGFGPAPKFPTPHNLLFLLSYYKKSQDKDALLMAETTLRQMYRGGLFDHIGYGFSRYSTDRCYLVPHFEKMLYDNALLMQSYCYAYSLTKKECYRKIAEKTADYILREMTSKDGSFYSAQDADSEGVEGKYYIWEPNEITTLLGEETGQAFNQHFNISKQGNFEGKNIPNLLHTKQESKAFDDCLPILYQYRKNRYSLHLDDKILTSWNALMIAAFCSLYRISGNETYKKTAVRAWNYITKNIFHNGILSISFRNGILGANGILDDYASCIYALLALYEATYENPYLEQADSLCQKTIHDFWDEKNGGFFLSGKNNEALLFCPKETYDGAIPSGNSLMSYNLLKLQKLTDSQQYGRLLKRQLSFQSGIAKEHPSAYSMFLLALSDYLNPADKITVVCKNRLDIKNLPCKFPLDTTVRILEKPTTEYPLKNDSTTYYVCWGHHCEPPENSLKALSLL